MEELQLRLLEKQLTTKFFLILGQKGHFFPQKWWHHEKRYSPKSVYCYKCFSVWKKVDGESLVHDKVFVLINIFCKNSYIFFKNNPIENIFVLNPSPKYCNANMQK